ncbi:UNVERIFIED_CONTAM: hypothetical protein GTU68_052905 [Idotea baltica]|nr:hypothetical protein [Idotea baltica]
MKILEIIIAIILPPLAVLIRYGISGEFLISIILTLFGYIPGLIHAIYVMSKDNSMRVRV